MDPQQRAAASFAHAQFFMTRNLSDDYLVLAFHGELDMAVAPVLLKELADVSYRKIRFDLSNLDFIDTSGLAVLTSTQKSLQAIGGDLVLVAPQRQAKLVLEASGLVDYFSIEDDSRAIETETD